MTQPPPTQQHPALIAYATCHRIAAHSPPRTDGRLTVRVEGRWRVHLTGTVDGRMPSRIVLSTRLLDLSGQLNQPSTDDLLVRLASLAAGRLKSDASGLALDRASQALLLLEILPASSDLKAVETSLADFVNVLAFWGRAIQAEKPQTQDLQQGSAFNAASQLLNPHIASLHAFHQSGTFAPPPQVIFP